MAHHRINFFSRRVGTLMLTCGWLIISGSGVAQTKQVSGDKAQGADGYRTVEWTELMPREDLRALINPPVSLNDIVDGSPEDQIASDMQLALELASDSRYQQALVSTQIVPAFDGQAVRLPGYIVPLEFGDDQQEVTRFFLVPYFGACIHMPPPPPNQIVYAEYEQGFTLESLYDPFWISGTLSTQLIENDTATAAYSITVEQLEPYEQ